MKIDYKIYRRNLTLILPGIFFAFLLSVQICHAEKKPTPEQLEHFENHIRPVLVKHCYECHNSGKESESDIALDHRDAFRKGGENGPLVDFDNPDKSLLLRILKHEIEDLEMPYGGEKLDEKTIKNFSQWLKMGAPDPRDHPPSEKEIEKAASWDVIREKRKEWWSFQPIRQPSVPYSQFDSWSDHPVDHFIARKLDEKGLSPANTASKRKLIRRLSFVLTGLPPTLKEMESFLNDQRPDAYEKLVDYYLASDHFGERWARHWMDWVRYTDTHGSEGDPAIPSAYQYRDYLIRAINQDVPYDQLVREHIAGDLLSSPRVNQELGINESSIGIAHWRMVFHGFSPTDPLDEKVRFTDDQINVFSKAFLGMTVSCARCHNHKFDAISQKDYYALFGILGSTRPATIDINLPDKQDLHKKELSKLKNELRSGIADEWMKTAEKLSDQMLKPTKEFQAIVKKSEKPKDLFYLWKLVQDKKNKASLAKITHDQITHWVKVDKQNRNYQSGESAHRWKMSSEVDQKQWFRDGNGLGENSSQSGDFHLNVTGDQVVTGIYPSGIYSHLISNKHRGILHSPRFLLEDKYDIWFRTIGADNAMYRYVVHNYPRSGTIYPVGRINDKKWIWRKYNVDYWKGDHIHLEISTAADQAILVTNQNRSWFGVRDIIVAKKGEFDPTASKLEHLNPLYENLLKQEVGTSQKIAEVYQESLIDAIKNWKNNSITDSQSLMLDAYLRSGILPNQLKQFELVKKQIEQYRNLENEIPLPTRSPGVFEADNFDQPLMERGNHKNLKEPVPRRFLEAIDSTPYQTDQSGRLNLAEDMFRKDNPFTARVIVNRLWHYVFGKGIVQTADNFGRLGSQPTHPELLDFLAFQMKQDEWSLKKMIRFLVLTKTFRLSSEFSEKDKELDPSNELLSHSNLRRLDAEAIRDSILVVSGKLDIKKYGPGFPANGQGKRRSVYMKIRRNSLDEFLQVFDSPVPFATTGRRNVTNVPAQSLALMNNKWVIQSAENWVRNDIEKNPERSDEDRVSIMFEQAFGESPSGEELKSSVQFIQKLKSQYAQDRQQYAEIQNRINNEKAQVQKLLKPARDKLYAEKNIVPIDVSEDQPSPDALWQFNGNANDSIGTLHASLRKNAKIQDGALILDGTGYAQTVAINQDVREKTLEAWVVLETLDQSGGGVMTIQTLNGVIFDSIVYAERQPKHWLAGSNNHIRTLGFNGTGETSAKTAVHMVITYDKDGSIRSYRNGVPYGKPIRKSALQSYKATDSQILFGLRHGSSGGNRMLKGKILEARLYFKALSEKEIRASAKMNQVYISEEDILNLLSADEKKQVAQLKEQLKQQELRSLQLVSTNNENQEWNDFAHALFNLKKFIYID